MNTVNKYNKEILTDTIFSIQFHQHQLFTLPACATCFTHHTSAISISIIITVAIMLITAAAALTSTSTSTHATLYLYECPV